MIKLLDICLVILTGTLAFAFLEAGIFEREAGQHVSTVLFSVNDTLGRINTVLDRAAAVEDKLSVTADQQTKAFEKTQNQLYKTVVDAKEIIGRTDYSLNKVLVPRLAITLESAAALETGAAANLDSTTTRVNTLLEGLQLPLEDVTVAAKELPRAVDNLAIATGEGAQSMKSVHTMVDYELHELTKPVRKVQVVAKVVIRGVGWFFGF